MLIDKIDYSDLISDKYMHKKINENVYLSDYQMTILDMYGVNYKLCSTTKDLIFLLNEVLEEEDSDELEDVCKQICEFDYYHNTNK